MFRKGTQPRKQITACSTRSPLHLWDNTHMAARLTAIPPHDFPAWLSASRAEYEADLVATGSTPETAARQAAKSLASAFPDGEPSPTNAVFNIVDEADRTVGYLWVGRDNSDDPTAWWVWDIVVDPVFRGRGLGREGMRLAEEYARSQGAASLGLNVFGFNTTARGLYESLGYETTSVKMRKKLTEG